MSKLYSASNLKKLQTLFFVLIFLLVGYLSITTNFVFKWNLDVLVSRYAIQREGSVTNSSALALAETNETCGKEPFAYKHTSVQGFFTSVKQKGIPFNCSLLKYLEMFKLTDQYKLPNIWASNYDNNTVFLGAINYRFFPAMELAFHTVRKNFGCRNKFILYDLGGLRERYGNNITQTWCNIELRQFDFKKFPKHVQNLRVFSWKILLLAQVLTETSNIAYMDSSIFFTSGEYKPIFDQMMRLQLTPTLMPGVTNHSIDFATNPHMFKYLPLDLSVSNKTMMFEANFILMHRSEPTRELMKWATLCALTLDCINPPGSQIFCNMSYVNQSAMCNRQDQSILSILVLNQERQLYNEGYMTKFFDDPMHPTNFKKHLHEVRRRQNINMSLIELYQGI